MDYKEIHDEVTRICTGKKHSLYISQKHRLHAELVTIRNLGVDLVEIQANSCDRICTAAVTLRRDARARFVVQIPAKKNQIPHIRKGSETKLTNIRRRAPCHVWLHGERSSKVPAS